MWFQPHCASWAQGVKEVARTKLLGTLLPYVCKQLTHIVPICGHSPCFPHKYQKTSWYALAFLFIGFKGLNHVSCGKCDPQRWSLIRGTLWVCMGTCGHTMQWTGVWDIQMLQWPDVRITGHLRTPTHTVKVPIATLRQTTEPHDICVIRTQVLDSSEMELSFSLPQITVYGSTEGRGPILPMLWRDASVFLVSWCW